MTKLMNFGLLVMVIGILFLFSTGILKPFAYFPFFLAHVAGVM